MGSRSCREIPSAPLKSPHAETTASHAIPPLTNLPPRGETHTMVGRSTASPRPFVKTLLRLRLFVRWRVLGGTGLASRAPLGPPRHGDNTPTRASPCSSHRGRWGSTAPTTCSADHVPPVLALLPLPRICVLDTTGLGDGLRKLCHSCASPRTCELKCKGPLWRSDAC